MDDSRLMLSCSPVDKDSYMNYIEELQSKSNQQQQQLFQDTCGGLDLAESNLRGTHSWAPDDAVSHCNNCHRAFNLFWRKHHCRYCGRIFCSNCTQWFAQLPRDLDNFARSPERPDWFSWISSTTSQENNTPQPERVCESCKGKVDKLWELSSTIRVISSFQLDIRTLYACEQVWSSVSPEWASSVRSVQAIHKDLQYRLPWYPLSKTEKAYLRQNMAYFAGHNRWLVLMLKAINWKDDEQAGLAVSILKKPKSISCDLTLCKGKHCHTLLQLEDAVELLSFHLPNKSVFSHIVSIISKASDAQFECLIPLLVFELCKDKEEGILGLLLQRSKTSPVIRSFVYWNLVVLRRRDKKYSSAYERFMLSLHKELGETVVWNELIRGRKIIKMLSQMPDASKFSEADLKNYIRETLSSLEEGKEVDSEGQTVDHLVNEFEDNRKDLVSIPPTVLPCAADYTANGIDLARLRVKASATSPVVISFTCQNRPEPLELLYKPECLMKDQIALCVIRLMDEFLRKDGLDLHIVTYRVLPTDENAGLIEIIPDSETIYSILNRKNFTLQNWILEHARERTIDSVRENFVKSTAAYCVISYLLAVGDRHLDNIMITAKTGRLFHIDYSYFMGFDPKPMAPYMRITQDIVDALGGQDSRDYLQFKEYCSKAYNCLRGYTNLFACMLRLITEDGLALDNGCFTRARLEEELLHRFVPGESLVEAELQLLNRLTQSHSSTPQFCIDFWHYHSRETNLTKVLSKIPSWGFKSLWPFSSS